jgi:hypothetical protein
MLAFDSGPIATVSARETAWHDLVPPLVENYHYAMSALAGSLESILVVRASGIPSFSLALMTNEIVPGICIVKGRNAVASSEEFINEEGFQCMVDILLKLRRMNLKFSEVALVLRYDRKGGKSKMKVVRTALKTMGPLRTISPV